mgnify:CR=1 FL=1
MQNFVYIAASNVLRKDADDLSTEEGFNVVNDGAVQIDTGTGELFIFERDDLDTPVLQINLRAARIRLFRTFSRHYNHFGVTMTVVGKFDRDKREIVTIKMERESRDVLREAIGRIGL